MLATEWQTAASVWLRWPSRSDIWPQRGAAAQDELCALIQALVERQIPVNLQVQPESFVDAETRLQAQFGQTDDASFLELHACDFGEIWLRDCAPFLTISERGEWQALGYAFDGWGGIDDQFGKDLAARDWLAETLKTPVQHRPMVLEGGAIHHDGEGTAMLCTGSILYRQGNQGLSAKALAQELETSLGLNTILTLPGRLNADETGGHVDNFACFVRPGEVVVAMTQDASHPDYATCRRVSDYLHEARDAQGRSLKIHTLPLPRSPRLSAAEGASIEHRHGIRKRIAGMALMATYVNFLRVDMPERKLIVLPGFGLPTDAQAQRQMQEIMPDHEVLVLPARALVVGGGAWHCASFVAPRLS
ncbi:MAG: agmatine deiminase family protein [Gammaproteobacteria bacterium]|nr:agmatine deiminase family protein [Gammaproteobacteria bacterium]